MSNGKRPKNDRKLYFFLLIIIPLILMPFIIFKDKLFVITSDSMSPTLNVGDLVISGDKDPEDIKADEDDGDIVILRGPKYFYEQGFDPIFWNYLDNNTPIIHRAIDKMKIGNEWFFLTKGDNNLVPDGGYTFLNKSENYILVEYNNSNVIYISETEILGVVVVVIPYVGYLNIYFPVILIIFIGVLIFYLVLKGLKYEIRITKKPI